MKKILDYKLVLFDLDGTLIDINNAWAHSLYGFIKEFIDSNVIFEDCEYYALRNWEELFMKYGVDNSELEKIIIEFDNFKKKKLVYSNIEIFPNLLLLLDKLKKSNIIISIVTNSSKSNTDLKLKSGNLYQYFDYIVTKDDVIDKKPSPEGIFKALSYFNISAIETILIGDTYEDINAAHNASIDHLLFHPNEKFMTMDEIREKLIDNETKIIEFESYLDLL